MNKLRQTCAAIILSLALAVSAFAGQIDSPGVVSPPPPPGDVSTPGVSSPAPSDETQSIAATIFLTVISLIVKP